MLLLLTSIFLLHLTAIILLLISTAHNAWWIGKDYCTDIWKQCFYQNSSCEDISYKDKEEYLQTVQAAMVLAVIFSCCGLLIFICQLFSLKKGNRFIFTGLFQLLSCLCVMTAASVYTVHFHHNDQSNGYGSSYILAWICFPLTLLSSIMYVILRKRE
ncbi:peripheral myelin protein 22-like [Carcharodon carcharias]|uniref:peripheral myelin protein 22-like n=1 Tax=Carcharodon carcharias TaxID=13397 RepID=UPI001B7DBD9E|nr:peripheral myelin protein 22-like [Carcharodon carcharias]XP_041033465.1 peripheral myelin protein 22-like [Carcharodon carcharias]XP_041033466.1 peripheral myelin protein 22-like [Carcharodon carcharias]XP_041033467.1 peripheral myelin protein 22-like [Carcharodon carcharias]XP_041033468.1 peripheral myelin protein 22-like [Carcharodon carcharias]